MKADVIFWGGGDSLHYVAGFFDENLINVVAVADRNKAGESTAWGDIISPQELLAREFDYLIITSIKYADEIFEDAVSMGIGSQKIIKPAMSSGEMVRCGGLLTAWGLGQVNFLKSDKIEHEIAEVRQMQTALRQGQTALRQGQDLIRKRLDRIFQGNNLQFLKNHYEAEAKNFIIKNFVANPELGRKAVFDNREEYREYIAPLLKDKHGLFLEFGVFEGKTINHMSRLLSDRTFYGFDSFEGLPETWHAGYEKGHFSLDGDLPWVNPNVKLVKGWFNDTLPAFLKEHPGDAHIFMWTVICTVPPLMF